MGRAIPSELLNTDYSDGCGTRCGARAGRWWMGLGFLLAVDLFCTQTRIKAVPHPTRSDF